MKEEQIEAIRNRARGVDSVPWDSVGDVVFQGNGLLMGALVAECADECVAEYLCHAREDIPALLAEVERLKSQLSEAESLLSEAHDIMDNVHLYDTELYEEISKYFDGGDA